MKCLNDVQIQAVADHEADDEIRQHAASCPECDDRVRNRCALTATIAQTINVPIDVPPGLSRRVEQVLADGSVHGATRIRDVRVPRAPLRRTWWSAAAIAAAAVTAVLFVAPMVKGPTTVSAAEILARSADRLATPVTSGVELLEYELVLDGVTREMMPDHADGTYRLQQVIDHDTVGRYLMATYGPDGQLLSSVAQDPVSRRRVVTLRVEDQPYRFEFDVPESVTLSLPEIERLHMQASVTMMQASGNQSLQVIESSAGRQYRIEVPQLSAETPNAVWDLAEARVVIDGSDYHIVEFAVKGSFLKQPYSVSYRLISRTIAKQVDVPATAFEVPHDAGALTIRGEGTVVPIRDALVVALRELAKAKRSR